MFTVWAYYLPIWGLWQDDDDDDDDDVDGDGDGHNHPADADERLLAVHCRCLRFGCWNPGRGLVQCMLQPFCRRPMASSAGLLATSTAKAIIIHALFGKAQAAG